MERKRSLLIAAPQSGSGKTLITCALLEILKKRNLPICSFKCGPDYIDPMFHEKVMGIPSENLDLYFLQDEQVRTLYERQSAGKYAVVEGVMGLYDGVGAVTEQASAYHLASTLRIPILLVVNAKGLGRSILAQIAGFLALDRNHLITGILLNRVSGTYYETLKQMIEQELSISVVGCFPERKDLQLESRHLGLKLPGEVMHLEEKIKQAAEILEENLCLEQLFEMKPAGDNANEHAVDAALATGLNAYPRLFPFARLLADAVSKGQRARIAIARDEAFCFYYRDNLRYLEEHGAELSFFSPLYDKRLPEGTQGILLGGGYPELYAEALAANEEMKKAIREAIIQDIPSMAECGGFMYLHEHLITEEGISYPMVGVIQADCAFTGKLVRFGYVELDGQVRGHEFHYFDSAQNGTDVCAIKPVSGKSWTCGHLSDTHFWGFPHLYYRSMDNHGLK